MDEQQDTKDPQSGTQKDPGVSRRRFIGALGAAAAAGAFLETGGMGAEAQNPPPSSLYFVNSFGNIAQINPQVVEDGVPLPPLVSPSVGTSSVGADASRGGGHRVPPGRSIQGRLAPAEVRPEFTIGCYPDFTFVSGGYTQPNILLIMVDQFRSPRWLTSDQLAQVNASVTPNISGRIQNHSYDFSNFFVAATMCSPSRATLLTGLYSQQTCMFKTVSPGSGAGPGDPTLRPYVPGTPSDGFPTIGNVLSQVLPINNDLDFSEASTYDTAWIGKWHLSDAGNRTYNTDVGLNGPRDYGFNNPWCMPNKNGDPNTYPAGLSLTYPSADGEGNNGNAGDFLDTTITGGAHTPLPQDSYAASVSGLAQPPYLQLNDYEIYIAFTNWANPPATYHAPVEPWFCAVSFVNPHDISHFPYMFGLNQSGSCGTLTGGYTFGCMGSGAGYQPPPTAGCSYSSEGELGAVPGTPSPAVYVSGDALPLNCVLADGVTPADNVNSLPYSNPGGRPGKPGLQAYFQHQANSLAGSINNAAGWQMFMNYYYWMEACVDALVGNVLDAVPPTTEGRPTHIIFTSDHGEFGGSHWLHRKGSALYDETLNVPFYVSLNRTQPHRQRDYVCSSVDVLPFIYTLALGNESWRGPCGGTPDMVWYLNGRESIYDKIYDISPSQRRVATITVTGSSPKTLPYVLHTTDENPVANFVAPADPGEEVPDPSTYQPSHAIAFRTVDKSLAPPSGSPPGSFVGPAYGGGKLGMYTYWPTPSVAPDSSGACESTSATNLSAVWPDPAQQMDGSTTFQFEFYNYDNGNYGEVGNDAFSSVGAWDPTADAYLAAYNSIMAQELYYIPQGMPGGIDLTNAYNLAFNRYMSYLQTAIGLPTGSCTPNTTGSPVEIQAP